MTTTNPGDFNSLDGISCLSSSFCMAVGDYSEGGGAYLTLAEQWNGSSWSTATTPSPSIERSAYNFLHAVSCTSSTFCVAVGESSPYNGAYQTLAELWNGSSWATMATTNPGGFSATYGASSNYLDGVSCTSPSFCVAVGYYYNSGFLQTLAEQWNGSSWSTMTTTNTGTANDNYLKGISCTSPSACVAVGNYDAGSGDQWAQTVAEQWNGSSWSTTTTTNPGGANDPYQYLEGVSCTSPTSCVAVGEYDSGVAGFQGQTLAEQWDGTSWSTMATGSNLFNYLDGVTCTSTNFCVAVGYAYSTSGGYTDLAELWNGSSWSTMTTQSPGSNSRDFYNVLSGVSCQPSSFCVAAGSYVGSTTMQTLAETYGNPLGLSL